jgi:UDP-glucose:(heptosyl)LPS alpha-1,3-glucosyltransferase
MNKIYFIRANKTKFGGAEVYLSRLTDGLKKQGVEHEIINSNLPKFLPSWIRAFLFDFKVCREKQNKFYFSLERVRCPDIYRAGDGVHKVFLEVEKKSKMNPLHMVYLWIEKQMFNNAKKIIANSKMVKQQIIATYDIDPKRIEVIYNGVPLKPLLDFESIKEEFLIKDEKILLYVGSGFKRKGVEEVLEIISKLQYQNIKCFIVGKEKKLDHYKNKAKQLCIEEKIIFTGPRTDVDKFYSIADIFLFPTHYEPFSNVILEAMSFKNAVFTTKQNGAAEILDEIYVMQHPKDFSVVQKIDNLFFDENRLSKIKKENIQKVQSFSIEKNVKDTLSIINKLLKS